MPSQCSIFDGLIVDNFAGGGGASTGIKLALGRPVDIAVNHDPDAIAMHSVNHPHTRHYCESVWDVDPVKATQGQPVTLAWFSPDCKHFSKAKGGKPVDKTIRGLAWVAVKWAAKVQPRIIMLENVEEFKTWCPVKDGQPDKTQTGKTFRSFVSALRSLGYEVDWRELKACDYGAPTIRKRFFLVARCDGQPIIWPEPTHGAPNSEAVLSGRLKPYRTAAEIIDWTIPCPSIFDTAAEIKQKYGVNAVRPLADATLRRIARGIKKFVIDNPNPFIIPWTVTNTGSSTGKSVDMPIGTIKTGGDQMLVVPQMTTIGDNYHGQQLDMWRRAADAPSKNEQGHCAPSIIQYHMERDEKEHRGQPVGDPLMTLDAANRYGMVAAFLSKYYSGGHDGKGNDAREPINTITSVDHNAVVASNIVKLKGVEFGTSATSPLHTITAGGQHFGEVRAFLTKYYGVGIGGDCNNPTHTLTTRDRLGLVVVRGEEYAIVDIGLRMLTPRELFNAQGFPADYVIDVGADGEPMTKSAQVARCGNSVCPALAEALVRANLPEQCGQKIETMYELEREMVV